MTGGRVKMKSDVTIPAQSEKFVSVKWKSGTGLVHADFMLTKFNCSGVYVAKSRVLPDNDGIFNVTVLNTSDSDVKLKSGRKVGKLVSCFDTIAEIQFEKGENQMKDIKNLTIGDQLSGEERNKLATLLEEYDDVFARNPKKPQTARIMTHKISTSVTLPVYRKPYQIPAHTAHTDNVAEQVQEMLENDIIRPSKSP